MYFRTVCTAPAFVPPVCSSGYCTFCSPSYSSALPLLLMLCFSVVYKLLDTPLYSSWNIDLSNSLSSLFLNLPPTSLKYETRTRARAQHISWSQCSIRDPVTPVVLELTQSCTTLTKLPYRECLRNNLSWATVTYVMQVTWLDLRCNLFWLMLCKVTWAESCKLLGVTCSLLSLTLS